jgi:hypothetical protein
VKVRVKAGYSENFPNVHRPSVGDRLKLFGGQVPIFPLNRFKVLKNAVGIVRRWTRLGQ